MAGIYDSSARSLTTPARHYTGAGIGQAVQSRAGFIGMAEDAQTKSLQAASAQKPNMKIEEMAPAKNAGGAIMSGAGGAAAGAQIGTAAAGPGYGTAFGGILGFIVGAVGYALS